MMMPQMKPHDYAKYPFIVIWEVTRACALKCLHCRAEAQHRADPGQLTTEQGKRLIDDIAAMEEQPWTEKNRNCTWAISKNC